MQDSRHPNWICHSLVWAMLMVGVVNYYAWILVETSMVQLVDFLIPIQRTGLAPGGMRSGLISRMAYPAKRVAWQVQRTWRVFGRGTPGAMLVLALESLGLGGAIALWRRFVHPPWRRWRESNRAVAREREEEEERRPDENPYQTPRS